VRQLSHVIEQSYVLDSAPYLPNSDSALRNAGSLPSFNLAKLREEAIRQALKVTRGHKRRAAKLLGVHPNTLTRMLAQSNSKGDQAGSSGNSGS
jgi:DNA-binding NtrC family response regulator